MRNFSLWAPRLAPGHQSKLEWAEQLFSDSKALVGLQISLIHSSRKRKSLCPPTKKWLRKYDFHILIILWLVESVEIFLYYLLTDITCGCWIWIYSYGNYTRCFYYTRWMRQYALDVSFLWKYLKIERLIWKTVRVGGGVRWYALLEHDSIFASENCITNSSFRKDNSGKVTRLSIEWNSKSLNQLFDTKWVFTRAIELQLMPSLTFFFPQSKFKTFDWFALLFSYSESV